MTSEEYRRELEQKKLQQRKQRKRRKRRRGLLIFLFLVICISIVAGLFYAPFFNITQVYCVGYETLAEEDILKAAAVPLGDNIFQTNVSELKRRVAAIPYVEASNVRRVFPNKIKIWVKECEPAAYIQFGDAFIVINTGGRVLETRQDNGAYALPVLLGLEVAEAVPGTDLRETVGTDKFDTAINLLTDLKNAELLERTNQVDVSYLKDIKIKIENRIDLMVGSYDSFAYKLTMVNKILADNISAYEKAIFDYRGDKLYVRPPDDAKQSETPQEMLPAEQTELTPNGGQSGTSPEQESSNAVG